MLGHGSNPAHGDAATHSRASQTRRRFRPTSIMVVRPAVYLPSILLGIEFPESPSRLKLTRIGLSLG
jgi:hypothetical protein